MAAFLAPVVEEIAFRGLLYTALCKRGTSAHIASLVSALAFAGIHAEPARLVILVALGLVLGEVRRRTGSTAAAIVTHVMNNIPAAVVLLVGPLPG
jgi:membrane protease YdiL (CAAX protease family)